MNEMYKQGDNSRPILNRRDMSFTNNPTFGSSTWYGTVIEDQNQ
jgi:hypothetical protein